jgi:hypothetical protein
MQKQKSTYLTILATPEDCDLDTLWPLTERMWSPGHRPVSAAGEPFSTLPTLTGHESMTVKPKPLLPLEILT